MNRIDKNRIVDEAAKLHQAGADVELLLVFLRERGFGQIDCIQALRRVSGLSLNDAKCVVDGSRTWSDQNANVQAIRKAALDALFELIRENDPDLPKISIAIDPE